MLPSESSTNEYQLRQVASLLWEYRDALDKVLFYLEAQLLFAGSGKSTRLSLIADLMERAAADVGELDLRREVLFAEARGSETSATGSATEINLTQLTEQTGEPWSTIFADHRRHFEATVNQIRSLADQSRQTMGSTLGMIDELVRSTTATDRGYDRRGQAVRTVAAPTFFDGRA